MNEELQKQALKAFKEMKDGAPELWVHLMQEQSNFGAMQLILVGLMLVVAAIATIYCFRTGNHIDNWEEPSFKIISVFISGIAAFMLTVGGLIKAHEAIELFARPSIETIKILTGS
jgi:uncharacterized protein YjeT (DUF2065 family)